MKTAAQLIAMASMLTLVAACVIGGRVTPSAAGMTILATGPSGLVRTGELLGTSATGVIFLDIRGGLVFARFSRGVTLRNAPNEQNVSFTGQPDADDLRKLSTRSRYPFGFDEETLTRLLSTLDQAELEVWP